MATPEKKRVRVLLVDDHELTRLSLRLALSSHVEVTGSACNGKEALEMVRVQNPDVVVLDLQMPMMDGFSASSQIKNLCPAVKILAYSSLNDQKTEGVEQVSTFDAFCNKDTSTIDLVNLIQALGKPTDSLE